MKQLSILSLALLVTLGLSSVTLAEEGTWTGEIVDLACYVGSGAKGSDHSGCAKSCVKNGQPMGLLTDDGTLVLLAANHKDATPFESLKDFAGDKVVKVSGQLAEKDGMKVVTVLGASSGS